MFNEEERRIALARLRNENEQGTQESEDQPFWPSLKRAFTVHSTLCIIGYSCINVSVAGLSTFMPTVIRTLGRYGTIEIQLRTVPPFVVAAVWSVIISYLSWRIEKRGIWICISVPMAILVSDSRSPTDALIDVPVLCRATHYSSAPTTLKHDTLDASCASQALFRSV